MRRKKMPDLLPHLPNTQPGLFPFELGIRLPREIATPVVGMALQRLFAEGRCERAGPYRTGRHGPPAYRYYRKAA